MPEPIAPAPVSGTPDGAAAANAAAVLTQTPAPPAAAAAPAPTAPMPDWMHGFDSDTKGYAQTKGWKDPGELMLSYRNLEKLHGVPAEKLVKLPDGDDAAGMNSLYDKLGRPAKPEDYKLEVPKENGSPEFAKFASELFHKNGLSAAQGQTIVKAWNEYQAGQSQANIEQQAQKLDAGKKALGKEWGAALDQNTKVAARAAREFGVTPEVLAAMEDQIGYDGVMKFFHGIGSKMGESSFVVGQQDAGLLTPDQAKARINALKSDPEFSKRYTNKDAAALREMNSLHQMAYHGDVTLN